MDCSRVAIRQNDAKLAKTIRLPDARRHADITTQRSRQKKSQRDFIVQPGVGAPRLRWVVNDKMTSTPKELNCCARNGDATALRLENIWDG